MERRHASNLANFRGSIGGALLLMVTAPALAQVQVPNCEIRLQEGGGLNNASMSSADLNAVASDSRLDLGRRVLLGDNTSVAGAFVDLGNGASVFDVNADTVHQGRGARVRGVVAPFSAGGAFCEAPAVQCGGQDISVPKKGTASLAPGSYGQVLLGDGASVSLAPGTYNVCQIRTGRHVTIDVTGATQSTINVRDEVRIGDASTFEPLGNTFTPLVNATSDMIHIGAHATVRAFITAPNARLVLGNGASFSGAACARLLSAGRKVRIMCAPESSTTTSSTTPLTTTSSSTTSTITTTTSSSTGSSSTTTPTTLATTSSTSTTTSSPTTLATTTTTTSTPTTSTLSGSGLCLEASNQTTGPACTSTADCPQDLRPTPNCDPTNHPELCPTFACCGNGTKDFGETCDKGTPNCPVGTLCASDCYSNCQAIGRCTGSGAQCLLAADCPAGQGCCGNAIVEGPAETCDDGNFVDRDSCPSSCFIASCAPVPATSFGAHVTFTQPAGTTISGLGFFVDYPEGKITAPVGTPGFGVSMNLNDRLYGFSVEAVKIGGLPTTLASVSFLICDGAPAATAADFTCTVTDASDDLGNVVDPSTLSCAVTVP